MIAPAGTTERTTASHTGRFGSCQAACVGSVRLAPVASVVSIAATTASSSSASPGAATLVRAIASGAGHMCALTETGGLDCWGWNYRDQLGVGTDIGPDVFGYSDENYPIGCAIPPTAVRGLGGGVSAVTAGYASTYGPTSAAGS